MAELRVSVWFELVGADHDDLDDAAASLLSQRLNEGEKSPREHRLLWRDGASAPWLEWRVEWVLEGMATEDADARALADELRQTARTLASDRFLGAALSQIPGAFRSYLLLPKLSDAKLTRARAQIPLRSDDRFVLEPDPRSVLQALFKNAHAFRADIDEDFAELEARIDDRSLILGGRSIEILARVGTKYITASRRDPRSPLYHPPFGLARRRPYWAVASIFVLLGSFGLSWLPLHWWSLGILAAGTGVAVAWALWCGSRDGRTASTFFGLVPVLLLIGFAGVYSVALLAGSGVEFTAVAGSPHLRDPLLLSLSLAATVGFLDAQVSGWARSIVYLEMLLAVGYVGTAGLVTVRAASRKIDRSLATLLLERREGAG